MAENESSEQFPPSTPPGAEEDYEHLLDDYSHFVPPAEDELLQGRVLKVTPKM